MQERLTTVPRSLLDSVGSFHGVIGFDSRYLPILNPKNFITIPRSAAEEDPSFKQLVVYFTIREGFDYLTYWRGKAKGDTRLHAKFSFGFGGHVNEGDVSPLAALSREVAEEIDGFVEGVFFQGFINDDSDAIGKVHLGLLYEVQMSNIAPSGESNIENLKPMHYRQLAEMYDRMEGWSKHVHDFLERGRVRRLLPVKGTDTIKVVAHENNEEQTAISRRSRV
jgi:predicted NUDIX family phosphoesterase